MLTSVSISTLDQKSLDLYLKSKIVYDAATGILYVKLDNKKYFISSLSGEFCAPEGRGIKDLYHENSKLAEAIFESISNIR